ncbi:MAG: hypothetical protein R3C59_06825 [Planctomycetaceae bacterium]
MSSLAKAIFPACATFGPIMLALGSLFPNRDGTPYGLTMTFPGALMTTAALLIVFRALTTLQKTSGSSEQFMESNNRDAA